MLMKICIAAAVALGCTLAVPGASFAAGDKDKSATATASTDKPKAPASKSHKNVNRQLIGTPRIASSENVTRRVALGRWLMDQR